MMVESPCPVSHSIKPLNPLRDKNDRYEDLSKEFYNGFFEPFNNYQNQQKPQQQQHQEQIHSPTLEHPTQTAEMENDLFGEDLAQLFEDFSREEELNHLFNNKQHHSVINDVSLSEEMVYNRENWTEMQQLRDFCNQVSFSTSSTTSAAQPDTLLNATDLQTVQQWLPTKVLPNDGFPTSNFAYIEMQDDSLQAVVENEQIDYDHAYQSVGHFPLSPVNIGSSSGGRHQQSQMSPESFAVTAEATQLLFDPHHSQRHLFSDTSDLSSTCSRLSLESPRYVPESSTGTHESLRPASSSTRVVPPTSGQRKRGRQSNDEQLATDNELPVSAFQISEMSLKELQQVLKSESLNENQRQLIRKIRRRGKNKVAARTCRQRRTDRLDKTSHNI